MSGCENTEVTSFLMNPGGEAINWWGQGGQETSDWFLAPQGNKEDFLIQDYNVKDVEQDDITPLDPFDMSGPTYAGISEMYSDADGLHSASTNGKPTVVISTYHTKMASDGKNSVQDWVCRSPGTRPNVWNTLSGLEITPLCGGTSEENSNDVLRYVYKQYYGTTNKDTSLQGKLEAAATAIGKTKDQGLRASGDVVDGHSFSKNGYSFETSLASRLTDVLSENGYNVVTSKSGSGNGLDFVEKAENASNVGAVMHVVLWSRIASGSQGTGWEFVYNDTASTADKAKSFANAASDKLSGGSVSAMFVPADGGSVQSTSDFAHRADYYTILNWGDTPTVIFMIGDPSDSDVAAKLGDSSVLAEYADAVSAGLDAIQN